MDNEKKFIGACHLGNTLVKCFQQRNIFYEFLLLDSYIFKRTVD
jgi:hypothetical protein